MSLALTKNAAAMLRDFVRFARGRLFVALALIALATVFEAMGLLWIVGFARLVLEPNGGHGFGSALLDTFAAAGSRSDRLILALIVFGVLASAGGIVMTLRDRLLARLQLGYVEYIKLRLMRALAEAPYRSVARIRHERIVQVLTLDLQQVGVATSFALQSTTAMALLIGNCLFALLLAPLAAISILVLLLGFLAARPLFRRAGGLGRSLFRNHLRITEGTLQLLGALKAARAQNLQSRFIGELERASTAAMRDRIAFMDLQSGARTLWGALLAVSGGSVVALGILVVPIEPEILFGLLVAFSRLVGPVTTLHQGGHHMLYGVPAYESFRTLEMELAGSSAAGQATPAPSVARSSAFALEFEGVTYRHEGSGMGIRELDLAIVPGSFVGIAGRSGSGKTTLVDLAAGILEPQSGRVSARGVRLSGRTLAEHGDRLAYVAQDAFLFEHSLRRNFLLARPDASEAQIRDVLRVVQAEAIVERLEGGLEGTAGPRGGLVSAGERQRLALACALLRNPALLILDEATNAIDIDTERAILARLAAPENRPTILMIAHRPESLAFCDRILTISDGTLESDIYPDLGGRRLGTR